MANITDDNDLLILSDDDTQTDELLMEETNLDEEIIPSTEEIITFDEPVLDLENDSETISEANTDDSNEALDFGSDLGIDEDKTETETLEKEEEKVDEANFDLWDFGADVTTEEETIKPEEESKEEDLSFGGADLSIDSSNTVWTMEDILNKAVTDLETRLSAISDEKAQEEAIIADLKAQIEDLEIKVKTSNEKVSELVSEQSMINKNTKSLERMKTTNATGNIKTSTSTKVHNTKRKQAA